MTNQSALAALAVLLAGLPAAAQSLPPQANHPAVKDAAAVCAGDINRFCTGIIPGGGRIVKCLAANEKDVTPECKASILKAKAALGL